MRLHTSMHCCSLSALYRSGLPLPRTPCTYSTHGESSVAATSAIKRKRQQDVAMEIQRHWSVYIHCVAKSRIGQKQRPVPSSLSISINSSIRLAVEMEIWLVTYIYRATANSSVYDLHKSEDTFFTIWQEMADFCKQDSHRPQTPKCCHLRVTLTTSQAAVLGVRSL